jgi:DNA polymerase-1
MNRPPAPEDLIPQFPLTRDATRAFGLACIEQEGFEADDIMATLAVQAREAGGHVTIVSSDKDLMQLVGNGVEMYDAMKNKRIGPEQVEEKFGVAPNRVIDVQSLAGDSVDNVPGAPGIGVKTAALLINEYGDLDSLLERASEIKQPKRRETLIENADQIRTSRDLVTLKTDMEMDCDFDDFQVQAPDPEVVLKFLAEMEFRTMSARIANKLGVSAPEISSDRINNEDQITEAESISINTEKYELIDNVNDLNRWVTKIYQRGYVAVDTETTGLNDMIVDLVGICLSVEIGEACYIPVGHTNGEDDLFGGASLCNGQINLDEALEILRPVLQDPSII